MGRVKGIASPRTRDLHQRIIIRTCINMFPEMDEQGLDILAEALVTKNPFDRYPDIIVKADEDTPVFVMEVTQGDGYYYDRRKCRILKQRFPDCEFYIYHYERDILYHLAEDNTFLSSLAYEFCSPLFQRPVFDYVYRIG